MKLFAIAFFTAGLFLAQSGSAHAGQVCVGTDANGNCTFYASC